MSLLAMPALVDQLALGFLAIGGNDESRPFSFGVMVCIGHCFFLGWKYHALFQLALSVILPNSWCRLGLALVVALYSCWRKKALVFLERIEFSKWIPFLNVPGSPDLSSRRRPRGPCWLRPRRPCSPAPSSHRQHHGIGT